MRRRDPTNGAVVRIITNAIAVYVAAHVVPGIALRGGFWEVVLAGFLFGALNTVLKPLLLLLSLPLLVLTLGLFTLVVNGIMLLLLAWLLPFLTISGLVPAIVGSLLMGAVNTILHVALRAWC